ncbi:hypothetical protein B6U93_04505 [Candidatus Woesearchaeota archaeon ex4484_78]|nr:MAG: hypothetical protein B6U93_04505 [Candidatus Woesearchaeota archaeon ex4484_78]
MNYIADLHIHSRFARACSKKTNIPLLEKYARIKGVNLLGTGDVQHPLWLKELKSELTEKDGIAYTKNNFPFVLQTELSLIYTQDNKGRRVHVVVLLPSFSVVDQLVDVLSKRGRLDYDGRPIFKIPLPELVEILRGIDERIEIIPAHCLLPDSLIHTKEGVSKISNIKKEDFVLTHLGRLKKVNKPTCAYIKKRNCKLEKFKEYKAKWICAGNLEKGDIILYPRYLKVRDKKVLFLNKLFPEFFLKDSYLTPKKEKFNPKNTPINNKIEISKEFCRLIGYYLAEGYVLKDRISFTFNKREKAYIKDIKKILRKIFGKHIRIYEESEKSKGYSLSIYSKILSKFFRQFYSSKTYRAFNKKIPAWIIDLPPEKQKELVIGWWRGDKGYTTSEILANQIKIILLRLGKNLALLKKEKF